MPNDADMTDKPPAPAGKENEKTTRSSAGEPKLREAIAVVGIGASAGGLAALKTFFANVPQDSGLAFVVVHLSPDHESHLAELLRPHVSIPVQQVTATTPLEPNQVYAISPNSNLDTIDTHLRLTELEEHRGERAPIDHLFRTLAKTHNGHSVGVILTGTGSDGSLGLREVKHAGGLTVVQDPNEAEYDGMPQSAIMAGLVDLILPLEKIPAAIVKYARTQPRVPTISDDDAETDERRILQMVSSHVRARTGRDFSHYKRSTVFRRIARRMQLNHIEGISDYLDLLRSHPEESRSLADDLLVTVTSFFRDRDVYQAIGQDIIPELFDGKPPDSEIRVWSVGCATGEEAYSLAILLAEEASRRESPARFRIIASDLHDRSLRIAREGFYPGDIETDVSAERLKRFFRKEDDGYRVRKEIRERVVFAPHNVLSDPPFSRIDLITCRNLMIYLQRAVQQNVMELFHYALQPEGYLVLGTSEALQSADLFRVENKRCCIYRQRNVRAPQLRLPVFPVAGHPDPVDPERFQQPGPPASYGELHQRIVERYAPPSALLSPDEKVVHLSEHAGRYLVHPGGELTSSIFKLIRPELRVELRAALYESKDRNVPVITRPVVVQLEGKQCPVVLHVRPALEQQEAGFVLIIFEEQQPVEAQNEPPASKATDTGGDSATATASAKRKAELEVELDVSTHQLQEIIEKYETSQEELRSSNEELQSSNEELRSTLEELETGKEELQSMNEELQTVNQENRHKVEELAQLSNDLHNLLAATHIATLFLDRQLRILRFTPMVTELFNIRPADRGRPLSDITHRLGDCELIKDAEQVLATLIPVERELQDDAGRYYLTRVIPYRSSDDRIEGVLITFVEVTSRKTMEDALRESSERFRTLVEQVQDYAIFTSDIEGLATSWNEGVKRVLGFDEQEFIGTEASKWIFTEEDIAKGIPEAELKEAAETGTANNDRWMTRKDGTYFWATGVTTALRNADDTLLGYLKVMRDQTEQKKLEDELRRLAGELTEANRRKDEFLATLAHELRNPLAPIRLGMELMKTAKDDPEALDEIHDTVSRQTQQLVTLVDDLLDVSRITRGTFQLRRRPVRLREIVQSTLEAARPSIDEFAHELTVDVSDYDVVVDADPNRLAQVITNLLSNSAKYTPPGGRIWLTVHHTAGDVVVKVRDTGAGIPADKLEHIFEMFSRIEQHEHHHAGLGVGLTLAKQLVEMHDGTITAASEGAGKGSEFRLVLPIVTQRPPTEPSPPSAAPSEKEQFPLRVLVVDDNRAVRTMLSTLVGGMVEQVKSAGDGLEAIEMAADFRPHMILMDLSMPRMDGYEAARHIRLQTWGREMAIAALTGFGQDADRERSTEAGFNYHLVKPVEPDVLKDLLAKHASKL